MPFDQPTRNRLARFVADARSLLSEEFTRQLQHEYGMDPGSGDVADLLKLGHLDDAQRETARILRATLAHYLAGAAKAEKKARQETLQRIVREQAYTVLNRLAALRMAEARGLLIESVGRGYQSRGFQLYAHLAGPALGDSGAAYRSFLFSLFDELAVELPALFDRFSPQGRLFPREASLLRLLDLLNVPDLETLWGEDETLGWIYQYFNSSEERRQMRAESQAPRNSRELAVRNQFFTPRYVVEFLTDNTLGRIWYEMTQGRTALAETCRYLVRRPNEVFLAEGEENGEWLMGNGERLMVNGEGGDALSQEELLRQPIYIPHRPLKDPRDIKMLDSACGSMHFGLYSFDLYEIIYVEAWDLEGTPGASAFLRSKGLKPLRETYADKDALRRDVPRLIIEHNIHGIDIDPRAVQIAGLSLWLRAQRSWQAQGIKPQDRPRIQRSNIVCAEPMPGEVALLEEFLASLRADRLEGLIRRVLDVPATQQVRATARMADALCDLVRVVWDEMKLAGEAGSLLKIEQTLANAVRAAEREWSERMPLFRVVEFGLTGEAERVRYPRSLAGEEGADFWQQAEALVLAALQDYAEQAQNGAGYQRRLFASDAARGFAFVDVCRKRYDVVLMNPPFGELAEMAEAKIESEYSTVTGNMLCAFIESFIHRIAPVGLMGSVVDRTILIKNSYETFRTEQLLHDERLSAVIELGWNVLDANVEVAGICVTHTRANKVDTVFGANVTRESDKADALLECCNSPSFVGIDAFRKMPFATVNFEVPSFFLRSLQNMPTQSERFGSFYNGHTIKSDVFKRLAWEVPIANEIRTWERMWNGSDYSPFYVPMQEVVLAGGTAAYFINHPSTIIRSPDKHMRAGLCYGKRGDYLDVQILPTGFVLTNEGFGGPFDATTDTWFALALLNSRVVQYMINLYCGQHKGVGYVGQLPFPRGSNENVNAVGQQAFRLYSMVQIASKSQETDPHFVSCFFGNRISLRKAAETYIDLHDTLVAEYEKLDEAAFELYGVLPEEKIIVLRDTASRPIAPLVLDCPTYGRADIDVFFTSNLLSYLAGCAFGRWDIRYAINERTSANFHDPFAPLPICPPAMLQNAHGLPAAPADVSADYPLRISWPGILVDDPGHPEDIEARVRDALRVIWPDNADAIEQEACQILGVSSLREYFASHNSFFDDHLKRYSKSRRQAPIYWPLSTPSGSYTLWLYYHRLSDQMLYSCVNDFVEPKLAEVRGQRSELQRRSGRSAREEKELERLTDLEAELRELRDELLRVAAFWRPNLNDGVQITAAPLWRLFRHRAWQRRLRETWEQLEAGAYDWAHLALSVWPARVVPKCVTDRSLAIAHDLEDLFWVEDPPGSWRNLRSPDEEIEGLVAAQQSPARERLAVLLAGLARGRARGLRCAEVWDELAAGSWDDLEAALLLWPARVAEQCWDDPLLAVTLKINLPTKRTKSARERWVKEMVAAGCPDLAAALEEALRERPDRFSAFWSELARGDHDHLSLALALWPGRVVARCAADVELAEGHDVRRFLWVRGDGGWRRQMGQEQEVADEVARRQGHMVTER